MIDISIEKIISTRNNSKTILLSNAEFNIVKNKIYTIIGKNGSGKTTLIKSLTGLLDNRFYSVYAKVLFEGKDILSFSEDEFRELRKHKIKYVFQDAKNSFDHLKTLEYYFNFISNREEIEHTLSYFLLPRSEKLFKLYPYEISGGMAQRVSLTLALLSKPSLIILDEPTSGIDAAIANLFLLKLKEYVSTNAASILLVTQDLAFAQKISSKIAILSDRKLSEFLSPNELFNSPEIVQTNDLLASYLELIQ